MINLYKNNNTCIKKKLCKITEEKIYFEVFFTCNFMFKYQYSLQNNHDMILSSDKVMVPQLYDTTTKFNH